MVRRISDNHKNMKMGLTLKTSIPTSFICPFYIYSFSVHATYRYLTLFLNETVKLILRHSVGYIAPVKLSGFFETSRCVVSCPSLSICVSKKNQSITSNHSVARE